MIASLKETGHIAHLAHHLGKNIIIDAEFVKKSPLACSRYTKNRLLMVSEIVDLALKFEKSWWRGYYAEVQSRRG